MWTHVPARRGHRGQRRELKGSSRLRMRALWPPWSVNESVVKELQPRLTPPPLIGSHFTCNDMSWGREIINYMISEVFLRYFFRDSCGYHIYTVYLLSHFFIQATFGGFAARCGVLPKGPGARHHPPPPSPHRTVEQRTGLTGCVAGTLARRQKIIIFESGGKKKCIYFCVYYCAYYFVYSFVYCLVYSFVYSAPSSWNTLLNPEFLPVATSVYECNM